MRTLTAGEVIIDGERQSNHAHVDVRLADRRLDSSSRSNSCFNKVTTPLQAWQPEGVVA